MSEKSTQLQEKLVSMEKDGGVKVHGVEMNPMQEFNAVKLTIDLRIKRGLAASEVDEIIKKVKELFE